MMSEKTKKWLRSIGIKTGKTMLQTMVTLLPVAATMKEVNWSIFIGAVVLSGVASLLE